MKNYPEIFEQRQFSWSLFSTFYGLRKNPYDKYHLATLELLDECISEYRKNSDMLTKADLELLDKIRQMLNVGVSSKYSSQRHLYDQRMMELCEVYMKISSAHLHKRRYINCAADYARIMEENIDPLASIESQTILPLKQLNRAIELIDTLTSLPERMKPGMNKRRADILAGIEKLNHFDQVIEARRKNAYGENINKLMNGREVYEGNEVIKRYICGPVSGRTEWIRYFYTECTDEKVIEENCQQLFGGYNEKAEGYVGAYTLLQRLESYETAYWAGFNYSYEQMEANYD